jgi:hypothetical protein
LLNFLQRYHFQTWFSRFITSRFYKIDNIFIFPVLLKDINWNIRQFSYIVNKIKALFPLIFSVMKVKQLLFKNSFYPKRFHFQNNWFIKKKHQFSWILDNILIKGMKSDFVLFWVFNLLGATKTLHLSEPSSKPPNNTMTCFSYFVK